MDTRDFVGPLIVLVFWIMVGLAVRQFIKSSRMNNPSYCEGVIRSKRKQQFCDSSIADQHRSSWKAANWGMLFLVLAPISFAVIWGLFYWPKFELQSETRPRPRYYWAAELQDFSPGKRQMSVPSSANSLSYSLSPY